MTIGELQYALAVEPNDPDMNEEALPGEDIMVPACAGLVTINQESNIIRLVHYTAQGYLERTRMGLFPTAQMELTRICLTYLSFDRFADGNCSSDREMEKGNTLSFTIPLSAGATMRVKARNGVRISKIW